MKKSLLFMAILISLTACNNGDGQEGEKNPYANCSPDVCTKEMLEERIKVVSTTSDGYEGEKEDLEEMLKELYGIEPEVIVEDFDKLQKRIKGREESIKNGETYYSAGKYVETIIACKGQCKTTLVSYDEIVDLSFDDAVTFVKERQAEYFAEKERKAIEAEEKRKAWKEQAEKEAKEREGTCREVENTYTKQGLTISKCSYHQGKIKITVNNSSGVDLRYLRVDIYGLNKFGSTEASYYTNHGATIKNWASQTLEAYVDYSHSFEVEITEAVAK